MRACMLAYVHVYPQYSPLQMYTNIMVMTMIMQRKTTANTIPITIGITEDGALERTVYIHIIQVRMEEET